MAEVMRLKSFSSQEIIQNGNTLNKLDSLFDDNKNNQDRTKLEETVKWEPGWAGEKEDPDPENSNKLSSPTPASTPLEEEGGTEESWSSSSGGGTDSETEEEDAKPVAGEERHSFANPNYPGFSHLAHELTSTAFDRNNNDEEVDWVNRLEGCQVKDIYRKSKLDLGEEKESNMAVRASGKREKTEINNSLKKGKAKDPGDFDVYNIETAMPKIDLEAIESHLRAAREEERRRRNDREEIRRRLATGDNEDYYGGEKASKKPSLQARLQSGMNLQICFMNETSSDTESPCSESGPPTSLNPQGSAILHKTPPEPPRSLNLPLAGRTRNINSGCGGGPSLKLEESGDFFSRQARLQTEARLALAQAKDRARLQMEAERHRAQTSPITQIIRDSLTKAGIKFPEDRRRLSRQMLTDMNVAQLQVIVNDLHTQIEILNESLVKFLMERDELHMSQDSMLVDIEDVTRYLGAKENSFKEDIAKNNNNNPSGAGQAQPPPASSRPVITRIVSLGKK